MDSNIFSVECLFLPDFAKKYIFSYYFCFSSLLKIGWILLIEFYFEMTGDLFSRSVEWGLLISNLILKNVERALLGTIFV